MAARYSKRSKDVVAFADDPNFSAYSRDEVKAIQKAGIIVGKPNNLWQLTKAGSNTILRQFIELMKDEDSARSWVQNDANQMSSSDI